MTERESLETAHEYYVQPVPDHCDRITWRGKYFHLPLHPVVSQPAQEFHWQYSHHYTAENIAAIVADLRAVEDGRESIEWMNRDHKTKAGILWRVISALSHDVPTATQQQAEPANDPLTLAQLFHATYERLAPEYGYETRPDTKDFDPESKNGRLMVRVCAEISNAVFCPSPATQQQAEPDKMTDPVERARYWKLRALAAEGQAKSAATSAAQASVVLLYNGQTIKLVPADDEAVRKDAERYRLLRGASVEDRNRLEHYSDTALDVAIDAYLAKANR
jgi:hypothetical protein